MPHLLADYVMEIERLVHGGEPFGPGRRAPPAFLVDRQSQRVDQRAHLLARGDVRQARPHAQGRLVQLVERRETAWEQLAVHDPLAEAVHAEKAEPQAELAQALADR